MLFFKSEYLKSGSDTERLWTKSPKLPHLIKKKKHLQTFWKFEWCFQSLDLIKKKATKEDTYNERMHKLKWFIYIKALDFHITTTQKKNHKVIKKTKKTHMIWFWVINGEENEGEEVKMNWSYEKEESIKSEVGSSSEKAPERRDAPKLRRAPPCTPSSSPPLPSPATLFLFSLFWIKSSSSSSLFLSVFVFSAFFNALY